MKNVFIALFILVLSACSEEVKSIDYYKEHTTERMKMLEECAKKAEPLMANYNCSNANKAQASIQRMNTRGVNFSN
jgi:lipoprotein